MHKKTIKTISVFALLIFAVLSTSCNKVESVSDKRRKERQTISDYINNNNINVIQGTPTDSTVFGNNDYYLTPSGLYIHIVNKGEGEPPQAGEDIIVRFYEITMKGDTTLKAMESNEMSKAYEFQYNENIEANISTSFLNYVTNARAFNEAASYMRERGEAHLIVPSSIGFGESAGNRYTAYRYHIKTKVKY